MNRTVKIIRTVVHIKLLYVGMKSMSFDRHFSKLPTYLKTITKILDVYMQIQEV